MDARPAPGRRRGGWEEEGGAAIHQPEPFRGVYLTDEGRSLEVPEPKPLGWRKLAFYAGALALSWFAVYAMGRTLWEWLLTLWQ